MKRFDNGKAIIGWDGKPVFFPYQDDGMEKAEIDHTGRPWGILNLIWLNAPFKTQHDSQQGALLAQVLKEFRDANGKDGEGIISLEESVHTWLKIVAEQISPSMFKSNGNLVYEWVKEGFEKLHQPKGKAEAGDSSDGDHSEAEPVGARKRAK